MFNQQLFSFRATIHAVVSWREVLEDLRVSRSILNKLILILTNGLTKEWCISTYLFWKACRHLGRKSGYLHLALYLKQCKVVLMKVVGDDNVPQLLVPYVSLTRGHLPRIIPAFHRAKIRRKDALTIQLYMSLFSLSKLITLAAKLNSKSFDSIVTPSPTKAITCGFALQHNYKELLLRYVPGISDIPLNLGISFVPTWKTVPTCRFYKTYILRERKKLCESLIRKANLFVCLLTEMTAFSLLESTVRSSPSLSSCTQGILWFPYTLYAFDDSTQTFVDLARSEFDRCIRPHLPPSPVKVLVNTGRLSCTMSGDGKRRMFAIGNYINQRLLYPLHQWLFKVLRLIDTDGTFNQVKPLDLLKGYRGKVYSLDLKAATDRWPRVLLVNLIAILFGPDFAMCSVNSALTFNLFRVSFVKKPLAIAFLAGQPLGYYSSWPLFALSHHLLVWQAAEQVYPGKIFTRYAVLGDDIVIVDDKVQQVYRSLLKYLDVQISEPKTLESKTGAVEFAKRFRLDRLTIDVSPVSIKAISYSFTIIGWYQLLSRLPYPLRESTLLRLGGLGFKACSRVFSSTKHKKLAKRMIFLYKYSLDKNLGIYLSLCLAFCEWIHPNIIGRIWHYLWEYYAPREPILPPGEMFNHQDSVDFTEYTLYRGWMKQYLTYIKWHTMLYFTIGNLEGFSDIPEYNHKWQSEPDSSKFVLIRFGALFRIYDRVFWLRKNIPLSIDTSRRKICLILWDSLTRSLIIVRL